jgi:hypothetical protein
VGDPRTLPLRDRDQIVLEVGPYVRPPSQLSVPASLRTWGCVQQQRDRDDGHDARGKCDEREREAERHAMDRPPRASSDATATTSATAPTASATIASVDVPPPPPSDDTVFTTGAGVSLDSGPDQSTTVPSE